MLANATSIYDLVQNGAGAAASTAFPWATAGLQFGGNLLSSLFGGGGPSKQYKEVYNMLMGRQGQPLITDQQVNSVIPSMNAGLAPYRNQMANNMSRRVGLDSGAAWGEMMRGGNAQLQGLFGQLKTNQMNTNANYQQDLMRMLTGMVR